MKQILNFFFLLIMVKGSAQKVMVFRDIPIPNPGETDSTVLAWNESQIGFKDLSIIEKEFYYWVNYSRAYPSQFFDSVVVPLVNVYPQLKGENFESLEKDLRTTAPLPMLSLTVSLLHMAAFQAKDITNHNASPSHNSSTGETFFDRFKRFNLKNCGGENISYGAPNATPVFMLVMLYLDISVPDLGHRKALLNPKYINTGISAATYKNGNVFLVEDFACAQN